MNMMKVVNPDELARPFIVLDPPDDLIEAERIYENGRACPYKEEDTNVWDSMLDLSKRMVCQLI